MAVPLGLDQASFFVANDYRGAISVWSQLKACVDCPFLWRTFVDPQSNQTIVLNAKYLNSLRVFGGNVSLEESSLCTLGYQSYDDQGLYELRVKTLNACTITRLSSPRNVLLPIWVAVGVFAAIGLFWYLGFMWRRYKGRSHSRASGDSADTPAAPIKTGKNRVKCLDAFRGLTIMMMIFVNYGGGGYAFFEHAPWYGLTVADLIFPWFIFIMGVSISLSMKSQVTKKKDPLVVFWHIIKRSLKLFAIGLILNTDYTNLSQLRVPGVLQRFAISYLVVASMHLVSTHRAKKCLDANETPSAEQIIRIFAPEALVYCFCLILYSMLTFVWISDEGCPLGYQGPGGLHEMTVRNNFNCTGGAANALDRIFFGRSHVYQYPTSKDVYQNTQPHDPEGLLGTTMSILLTAIGMLAGKFLVCHESAVDRITKWSIMAVVLGAITLMFALPGWIPVVKNLWSLTFITSTGSIALIVLVVFYLIVDVMNIWPKGRPFHFPGMNAIALYVGHELLGRFFPFYFYVDKTSHGLLLFRVCWSTSLWLLISIYMAYNDIFFTL